MIGAGLALAAIALSVLSIGLMLRALRNIESIGKRLRQSWLVLGNIVEMLKTAGFKTKKPRDWGDDFSETRIRDPNQDKDWWKGG